ncbi:3-dehydroquinate synthase [Flagellatimonas centrodinii]|uniref:3-dehydroquinate synthase n=1 Tax=Flagellatimonas centrodinii TaxID=2806210 RepID=UPI001FEEE7C0|nr:3-dehydroquinate synthase [Flagellatimonas centrodinii]ULQ47855.1 3-dehydroquinate synthase [Flagellatimonas centrodinii]
MKRELMVELAERRYPIRIGPGQLGDVDSYRAIKDRPRFLLTDETVAGLYLAPLRAALPVADDALLVLPPGEAAKSWDNAERLLDLMLARRVPRDGVLIALGGGVVGDLAGFCAAVYQRGIDFLQIPTTLLAQVDSSVGGKTAVNHSRGKNMIGAFHQPQAVVADTDTLKTLPRRELLAGMAEVIKYGLLGDAAFFSWLEHHLDALLALDPETTAHTIEHCCAMKARIVVEDEREAVGGGVRALLNLGHTFGHAIETYTGYTEWLHGEAVATGMVMAADLSARQGWLPAVDAERARALIARAGLPVRPPPGMTPADFVDLMGHDKKVAGGQLRLVLLRSMGMATLTADFATERLHETLAAFTT